MARRRPRLVWPAPWGIGYSEGTGGVRLARVRGRAPSGAAARVRRRRFGAGAAAPDGASAAGGAALSARAWGAVSVSAARRFDGRRARLAAGPGGAVGGDAGTDGASASGASNARGGIAAGATAGDA